MNAVGEDISLNSINEINKPEGIIAFIKDKDEFENKVEEIFTEGKVEVA